MSRSRIIATVALLVAAVGTRGAAAQTLGVTATGNPLRVADGPFSLGYTFNVSNPFLVQYLGYFDANGDGLAESHDIGLWDPAGNLLASATVGAGTGDLLVGGFRLVPVDPFMLFVGTNYRVLGADPNQVDPILFDPALSSADGITYTGGAFCPGATLQDACGGNAAGYFGANFAGTTTPEPASLTLLATGLVGVFGVARRKLTARQAA